MRKWFSRILCTVLSIFLVGNSVVYGSALPVESPISMEESSASGAETMEESISETVPISEEIAQETDWQEEQLQGEDVQEEGVQESFSWGEGDPEEILGLEPDHYESTQNLTLSSKGAAQSIDNVIVFLRFQDTEEYITEQKAENVDKTFNQDENSLKKYLARISYGRYQVDTSFFPRNADGSYYSVELSHTSDYFKKQYVKSDGTLSEGYTSDQRIERELELVTEAMTAVRDQLDASDLKLDTNGDGVIDSISFVLPVYGLCGIENICHGDLLWPHKIDSWINVPVKGLYVKTYTILNRGSENIGIFGTYKRSSQTVLHEYLHSMGAPDLYRVTDQNAKPMGPWDIMDGGGIEPPNLSAYYQREFFGYGAPLQVISETRKNITLAAAQYTDPNEVYAIKVRSPLREDASFIIENRPLEAGNTEQKNAGLLVYRINESKTGPSAWDGNAMGPPDFIYAFRPGESGYHAGDGEIGYATISADNVKGFTSLGKALGRELSGYDNGIIYYADGANSGIIVDHVRKNADGSITFDLTVPEALKGSGTAAQPYEIYTVSDLAAIGAAQPGEWYRLMNHLDLSGSNFVMIPSFKGILDGNGKTISGLTISGDLSAGLVELLETGAAIRNVTFQNPKIQAGSGYAGIVAMSFGELSGVVMEGGRISSNNRAGGIVGFLMQGGLLDSCRTSAAVTAPEAGGLCSYVQESEIRDCFAAGRVSGTGSNPILGGIFANLVDVSSGRMVFTRVYWDMAATGQEITGRTWMTSSGKIFSGTTGIRMTASYLGVVGDTGWASIERKGTLSVPAGRWSSSVSRVLSASASSGSLQALAQGNASLYYTFSLGRGTCVLKREFTIAPKKETETNPSDPVGDFVTRLYQLVLGRTPDAGGWRSWKNLLVERRESGTGVAFGFIFSEEYRQKNTSDADYIELLYQTILGRASDAGGKAFWLERSAQGMSRYGLFAGFANSQEFRNICQRYGIDAGSYTSPEVVDQNPDVTAFVSRMYTVCLGRRFDKDGIYDWTGRLLRREFGGGELTKGFFFSREFIGKGHSDRQYVTLLYRTMFNREPDSAGMEGWCRILASGGSREEVLDGFIYSQEFIKLCQRYGIER